ncbi:MULTISPECIES: hypothetical protein [Streptomyces]|uniref:hypothetical protein n=1 Tax=Streptomyces TaxID=1883 RepID=UPI001C2E3663|nr:hypothetical protein [Streptomyces sp. BV129]MBV1949360.1 hypothetical protein [Streptomyces sp. BV129]MBV1949481.1 hypothetical protein [Streptomyces sp. BV129]
MISHTQPFFPILAVGVELTTDPHPPAPRRTARDVLSELSSEARQLAQIVTQLENEYLHINNPTQVVPGIVEAVKGLVK